MRSAVGGTRLGTITILVLASRNYIRSCAPVTQSCVTGVSGAPSFVDTRKRTVRRPGDGETGRPADGETGKRPCQHTPLQPACLVPQFGHNNAESRVPSMHASTPVSTTKRTVVVMSTVMSTVM